jgi:hypothetical protein
MRAIARFDCPRKSPLCKKLEIWSLQRTIGDWGYLKAACQIPVTPKDAGNYITKLAKAEHARPVDRWQPPLASPQTWDGWAILQAVSSACFLEVAMKTIFGPDYHSRIATISIFSPVRRPTLRKLAR